MIVKEYKHSKICEIKYSSCWKMHVDFGHLKQKLGV